MNQETKNYEAEKGIMKVDPDILDNTGIVEKGVEVQYDMDQEVENFLREFPESAKEPKHKDDHIDALRCTRDVVKNIIGTTDPNYKKILDSGERRQFESGAVRDIQEGKGRCDLLPLNTIAGLFDTIALRFEGINTEEDIKWQKYGDILQNIYMFIKTRNVNEIYDAIITFGDRYYKSPFEMILEVAKHYEEGAKKYAERNWEKGIDLHCFIDSAIRHLTKFYGGYQDEPHDRAFVWNMLGLAWTYENHPELDDLPYNTQKENNI